MNIRSFIHPRHAVQHNRLLAIFSQTHKRPLSRITVHNNNLDRPRRSPKAEMSSSETSEKEPAVSRPSSSVILLSPRNEVLLLHRVESSRNFPSAHVFPGGNLDAFHDGPVPESKARERHDDGPAYRRAAIRETFEESGILLARNRLGDRRLVELDEKTRSAGRHKVHERTVPFQDWLHEKNAVADVGEFLRVVHDIHESLPS